MFHINRIRFNPTGSSDEPIRRYIFVRKESNLYVSPDSPRGLLCPRCGYDLRGGMGDWSEACPLHGICPECGLEFEWADMVGSSKRLTVRLADILASWFGLSQMRTRRFFRWMRYRLRRNRAA